MADILKPVIALGPRKDPEKVSLSELYHENTKLHPDLLAGMIPSSFSRTELVAMTHGYKQYSHVKKVKLIPKEELYMSDQRFDETIATRRSIRDFGEEPLSLREFSKIMHQSYGITGQMPIPGGGVQTLRSAPSGGGLYPAEIYLAVRRVESIEPGIYHYNVPHHELELLVPGDPTDAAYEACCNQEHVKRAGVVVMISGVFQRTKRKYGERGYRYVLLDVGHLGQNIYLSCHNLGLAVMTTCGFFDDIANDLLRLDGVDETMLYVAFLGKRK
ncbi:SagB/ThcOx family dehydrogenase [Nitrospina sp. 32_T5]|uniref:SagB/ThcOx family dehydrogenase n=1 Tax=unclassified Nitrospina TaxID=2638683 RepID=UPI003F9CC70D